MAKTGIFYGSTTGNTEMVANKIKEVLGDAELKNINAATLEELKDYEVILLGSSTWGFGEMQDDWTTYMEALKTIDLEGKKVGFFGTGDQFSYPDTFVDALGLLREALAGSKAIFIGKWPKDGYAYSSSKAEVDGTLAGLAIDEENQGNKTDERVEKWTSQLKSEI